MQSIILPTFITIPWKEHELWNHIGLGLNLASVIFCLFKLEHISLFESHFFVPVTWSILEMLKIMLMKSIVQNLEKYRLLIYSSCHDNTNNDIG